MDMLDIYTDYLICQNKHATATGLSDMVDGEFSHDKVTRFLRLNSFDSTMLWAYVKPAVRERETQMVALEVSLRNSLSIQGLTSLLSR